MIRQRDEKRTIEFNPQHHLALITSSRRAFAINALLVMLPSVLVGYPSIALSVQTAEHVQLRSDTC